MAYPNSIDSLIPLVDGQTPVSSAPTNQILNAVLAVENTLGLNPQGNLATVAERLATVIGVGGGLDVTSGTLQGVTIGLSNFTDNSIGYFNSLSSNGGSLNGIIGANTPQDATFSTANITTGQLNLNNGVFIIFTGTSIPVNGLSGSGGILLNNKVRFGEFGNGLVMGEVGTPGGVVLQVKSGIVQTALAGTSLTTPPAQSNILDDSTGQMAVLKNLYFGALGNQTNAFFSSPTSFTTKINGNTYLWPTSSNSFIAPQPIPVGGVVLVGNPANNQLSWSTISSYVQTALWQKYIIQITGANGLQPGNGYVTIYYPNGTNNKSNPVQLTGTGSQQISLFSYASGMIIEGVKIAVLSSIEPITGDADSGVSGTNSPGTISCSVGPLSGTVDKYASFFPVSTSPALGNFQVSHDFFGEDPGVVSSVAVNISSSNSGYSLSNLNAGQFHIWVKTEITI